MNRKLTILFTCFVISEAAKIPEDWKCHISDKEFDRCLTVNMQKAIQSFKTGNPDLGIPPFEPLHIPSLQIGNGNGPVNVAQNFTNVELHHIADGSITSIKSDLANGKIYVESITPRIELLADYSMEGRMLVLPVKGSGRCNITLINDKLTHDIAGERYRKKGKTYFRVNEYKLTMTPERIYYYFDNLFEGDKRLGDEINKVMNENWREVYNDVQKSYDEAYGLIFKGFANSLFGRVPYDEIFLN